MYIVQCTMWHCTPAVTKFSHWQKWQWPSKESSTSYPLICRRVLSPLRGRVGIRGQQGNSAKKTLKGKFKGIAYCKREGHKAKRVDNVLPAHEAE